MDHEKRLKELEKERLQSSTEQEWIRLTIVINRQKDIMNILHFNDNYELHNKRQ